MRNALMTPRIWVSGIVTIGAVVAGGPAAAQSEVVMDTFAYVNIQRIAEESEQGQAANTRVQALSEQKLSEIEARTAELQSRVDDLNQQLQEVQQKLQQGQNVISADARLSLQREASRLQRDIQRVTQDSQAEIERLSQDADAEVQELTQQLQIEFERQLVPLINDVATEKGLHIIFNSTQGVVWADPALDLTQELIDRLDAAAPSQP